jgi:glycosyltransferase involved in cell wall biosynthesis
MANRKPMVSIIIPSYNHEKYIEKCILSILNQTFQDFEIVIIDDCSTDNSANVIRTFCDERIIFEILNRNSGMNVAVEKCMQKCTGKYIAFISSDDMWKSTKLEKQVDFLEKNKAYDAVLTQVEFIGEDGKSMSEKKNRQAGIFEYQNRSSKQWLRRFFYQGNCLCKPSMMIRKGVYKSLNYLDKRIISFSDFDFWVRFSFNHEFWILDEKLTKFRIRDNEMNISAGTIENRNRAACIFRYT